MAEQVRVTVSMDREHLAIYKRMAELGGLSVSRCLGEWLGDTVDSAMFVASNMEKARKAPQAVLNEMLAMSSAAREDLLEFKAEVRGYNLGKGRGGQSGVAGSSPPQPTVTPPLSNTGVKVPKKGKTRG